VPEIAPDGDGNAVNVPLRFSGQIQMPGDGMLYYNWNSYYDPSTGGIFLLILFGWLGGLIFMLMSSMIR